MKRKNIKKIVLIVGVVILVILAVAAIVCKVFLNQYNQCGISRKVNITINREIGMQYIGESEKYEVYTYQLEKPYCMDVYAKEHSLAEVLEKEKLTVADMVKGLRKVKDTKTEIVYQAENYQIMLRDGKCIIAPLESNME